MRIDFGPVVRGWAGGRWGVGGWGGRWQKLVKNCPEKLYGEAEDTMHTVHRYSCEAQWTQLWIQPQVDAIYLVHSTGIIMSLPQLHSVNSCPEKSRLIKYRGWMHSVMIANKQSWG